MPALLGMSVAGFSGYAALLAVAPLWAVSGGSSEAGAGWVNGVLLLATVVTQFAVPRLLARHGHARVLGAGLVLMGAPAPAYLLSDALAPVLVLSGVRGAGFGILTVTCVALVAELVPAERRGEAIGTFGLAVAAPNLLLLPASVAVVDRWGYGLVFWVAALPLAGIPAAATLGRRIAAPRRSAGFRADRRTLLRVARPTTVLFAVTMAGGAVLSFAPQVVASGAIAAVALLALNLTATGSRWGAGVLADRFGAERFLPPALLLGAGGLALCAWAASGGGGTLLVAGAAALGTAYGAAQSLTLVAAFRAADHRHIPTVSALWNVGFDAGTAAGSVAVGAVAAAASFTSGFWLLAALLVASLLLCRPRRSPAALPGI